MSRVYSILEGLQLIREYKINEENKFKREEFRKTEYDAAVDCARKHGKTEDDVHFDDAKDVWYVEYKNNYMSQEEENYLNAEFEREVARLKEKYKESRPKNRKCVLVSKDITPYVDKITSEEIHKLENKYPKVIWGAGDNYYWVTVSAWNTLKGIVNKRSNKRRKKK